MTTSPIPGLVPTYEDYARCVHCGLCLNSCPTYRLWNLEADSPRGRIRQMVSVEQAAQSDPLQKAIPLSASFVDHIDKCLDCRACETACPSGVQYGKLVEYARARIAQEYPRPFFSRFSRNFVFRQLLPYPKRIAAAARLLRIYQRSGLQSLARGTGILKLLGLAGREALLPPIDSKFFFDQLGTTHNAVGPRRARVAFFAGCVAQVTFTALNEATIRVLTANGCDVIVPDAQRCCGALAAHAGAREEARTVARKNLVAFHLAEFDAIVTNASGCGSTLKEYHHLFSHNEPEYAAAEAFSAKVRDVTEFLSTMGLSAPLQPVGDDSANNNSPQPNAPAQRSTAAISSPVTKLRVTYQDSCHLLHGQKVREAPRQLLRAIPNLEFVELPHSEICCGSAGSYNITQTQTSLDLLAGKMQHAKSTKADLIVTANPGCLLQMRAGTALHHTNQQVLHVIELLDRAIRPM
ncbi:MAG TPA: (Fe-S)-binding protein [Candidatus Dormibacteraeota bacterium]|nr:(Fe-S)-binding protein [Candidatus Dormibacteraeota bacterium]